MTRHLVDRDHRDIAVLAYSNGPENTALRPGYRRALGERGLEGPRTRLLRRPGLEGLRPRSSTNCCAPTRPSAIFALTNHSALAAIKAARALGLDIPSDLSIVGFDDFDWMLRAAPLFHFRRAAHRQLRRLAPGGCLMRPRRRRDGRAGTPASNFPAP